MTSNRQIFSAALLSCVAGMACAADQFDGTKPLVCAPANGYDCLPTEKSCKPLKPEAGKDVNVRFDIANMNVKTPYRTVALPIQSFSNNTKAMVTQGTSLDMVWNATINRTNGKLTITIADREGAYVIFGQCKVDESAAPAAAAQ